MASVPSRGVRRTLSYRGHPTEFCTLGDLADALCRAPQTVRRWEANGIIPKARYGIVPEDVRAKRRLYTPRQVEDARRAAWREGLHRRRNGRGGLSPRFREEVFAALAQPLPEPPSARAEGETGFPA